MKICKKGLHQYSVEISRCPECKKASTEKYIKNNISRCKTNYAAWAKANSDKKLAVVARRRAVKLRATLKWLTLEHLKEIREFYTLAKELEWLGNEPLEVDHIVPLQGKNVSGLHVPWNLQILPKSVNISKGNRL